MASGAKWAPSCARSSALLRNTAALIVQIDARAAKLSQLCHACGAYSKTANAGDVASRYTTCVCGRETAQRDLYSAFLARFCDARGCVNTRQALDAWPGASKLLGMAVSTYNQRTSVDVLRRPLGNESESVVVSRDANDPPLAPIFRRGWCRAKHAEQRSAHMAPEPMLCVTGWWHPDVVSSRA